MLLHRPTGANRRVAGRTYSFLYVQRKCSVHLVAFVEDHEFRGQIVDGGWFKCY